ncbi:MAG TPA: HAD domain-containing protein, partial [Bacillota bacterium]|nr:HAD domain-containing protein [Bacillota bacterium]
MKVIFLDIDGVMVTGSYQRPSTHYNGYQFNPSCVDNLKQIMNQTGASIVVSSTWRKAGFRFLKQMLTANGIDKGLVGQTPVLANRDRGDEIQQYIEESQLDPSFTVEQFVILDDHNDMGKL